MDKYSLRVPFPTGGPLTDGSQLTLFRKDCFQYNFVNAHLGVQAASGENPCNPARSGGPGRPNVLEREHFGKIWIGGGVLGYQGI